MKVTAISLLFLLFIPLVSAISFDFDYPESGNLNQNLTITINAQTSDIYDVKIFVQDNNTGITISEIYNEGWKNPRYYILSAFPAQSDFLIRIKNDSDGATICTRLRKSGVSTFSEKCGAITITNNDENNENEESENITSAIEEETSEISKATTEASKDFIPLEDLVQGNHSYNQNSPEKIFLSNKENTAFISRDEKLRNYAIYFFVALIIALSIYLAFKKL